MDESITCSRQCSTYRLDSRARLTSDLLLPHVLTILCSRHLEHLASSTTSTVVSRIRLIAKWISPQIGAPLEFIALPLCDWGTCKTRRKHTHFIYSFHLCARSLMRSFEHSMRSRPQNFHPNQRAVRSIASDQASNHNLTSCHTSITPTYAIRQSCNLLNCRLASPL